MAIDAILTGLGRLAGALPEARAMIGDVADVSPMGPRIAALGEMVKKAGSKAVKVVDDWGWKGGKPGELTGGMFSDLITQQKTGRALENKSAAEWLARNTPANYSLTAGDLYDIALGQLSKSPALKKRLDSEYVDEIMDDFRIMEEAGIPRKWTGKIAEALPPIYKWHHSPLFDEYLVGINYSKYAAEAAEDLSNAMRSMTNDQRETFLNLLPRWTGTLDQAVSAAKKLYKRPS